MIQLQLTDQDAETLREVLAEDVSDLRMEIADTDQMDFREMLKRRKEVLLRVLEALGVAARQP